MILIALGANLPSKVGSPERTIEAAKVALAEKGVRVLRASRTWTTPPFPASSQPLFRNAVISVESDLGPQELMDVLQKIEKDFGRLRTGIKNEARSLDLDLIAYHDAVIDEPGLHLPHPRMCERLFVLIPMKQVAPLWIDPVSGQTLNELIANIPDGALQLRTMKTASREAI
jgi:2-amino-4-hydroxy-6-hydroxymethyldihydropteridine diphosphokinase